jgi:hypothetical protein
MARTTRQTARILAELYDETFGNDSCEPFRITWPQLCSLAGVPRLDDDVLKELDCALREQERLLIPCDEFLLVAAEVDLSRFRTVPDRMLEALLPVEERATCPLLFTPFAAFQMSGSR